MTTDQRKTAKLKTSKVFVHESWFNSTFDTEGDIAIIKLPQKMRDRDVLKACTDFEGRLFKFRSAFGFDHMKQNPRQQNPRHFKRATVF